MGFALDSRKLYCEVMSRLIRKKLVWSTNEFSSTLIVFHLISVIRIIVARKYTKINFGSKVAD